MHSNLPDWVTTLIHSDLPTTKVYPGPRAPSSPEILQKSAKYQIDGYSILCHVLPYQCPSTFNCRAYLCYAGWPPTSTPLYTCLTTHRKASVVTQPLVYEKPQSDHKTLPFAFRLTIYIQTPYWPLSGISRNDDFEARPPTRLARVS